MKPKALYIDAPRLFGNGEAPTAIRGSQGTSYHRQVDDEATDLEESVESDRRSKAEKRAREVHFVFLAEKYQPLKEEDEAGLRKKDEGKVKKKGKIKKYRKVWI